MKRFGILSYAIITAWVFLISSASFFFPYVIDSISLFKIKSLKVEGLEIIPAFVISTAISEAVKNNLVFLYTHKRNLIERVNNLSGDAIEDIQMSPVFSSDGVIVKIIAKERKVFITVLVEDKVFFFDESGYKFSSGYYKVSNPTIYTSDLALVEDYFDTIRKLVKMMRSSGYKLANMYVTDTNTVIYTEDKLRITMPPIFVINDSMINKIGKLNNIDMQGIKSIDFISGGVVVVK